MERAYHQIGWTKGQTAGLLGCELIRDLDEPANFTVLTRWSSLDAVREWRTGPDHVDSPSAPRPYQDRARRRHRRCTRPTCSRLAASTGVTVTTEQQRPIGWDPMHIDVHHHVVPEFFRNAANSAGVLSGGSPWPIWELADTLRMLDEQQISSALLSIPPPGVHFGDKVDTVALARRCNDYLAEQVRTHPERFGAFGVLPLPYVDEAMHELERIFDVLGLDGVGLYTNVAGVYLGDDLLEPVFAELHRRRTVAYLHPVEPPADPAPGLSLPPWYGEFVFDTTRALTNMVMRGTLERNTGVSLIVAHAGGTAPYIVNRITNVWRESPEYQELAPHGPLAYLQRLYYDSASCGPGFGLRLVRDMAGASQIVLGSDYPFVPAHAVSRLAENLRDPRFLGVNEEALRANTLRLFPRFAATTRRRPAA